MTTETATQKADPFYRSSYAIKRDLEPGLKEAMKLLKLSLAEFLSMVAADPAGYEKLLGEKAAQHRAAKALSPRIDSETRAQQKEQRKKAAELLKNADPETITRMLEAAQAKEATTAE